MRELDLILGKIDGRYIKHRGSDHVAVLSATRAGKSSSYAVPNAFAWKGSLVCLDIKGEILEATAGHRAAMGQQIICFEPAALSGRSHRWNPFSTIDRTADSRFRDIFRASYTLFPEPVNGRGEDWFWEGLGRGAFRTAAMFLAETPSEPLTMSAVLRCATRPGEWERMSRLVRQARMEGQPYSRFVAEGVARLMAADEKRADSIRSMIETRLDTWSEPGTIAVTEESDFDIRDIRRRPMTIYVVVAPADVGRMSPLLRLFFGSLLDANTLVTPEQDPTLTWQTHVLLDEFARLGKIPRVGHFLQYAGGYGFRISLICQDKDQVKELYGASAAADIFANASTQVFLSGISDEETARELERRMGDDTVPITTRNRPRFLSWLNPKRQGLSDHPHRRPLMLAQEVLSMDAGKEIIWRAGTSVLADKIRWWRDPWFRGLALPPPDIPALQIDVPLDDGQAIAPRRRSGLTSEDLEFARLPASI